MSKKIGILRFLGTNCDRDVWQALEDVGATPEWLWYQDRFDYRNYQAFIIPGGFSYGDYLRCGAMAAKMPVMASLTEAANKGFPILGICNGFQILCEAKLLPGVLIRNQNRKFMDKWVDIKLENSNPHWSPNKFEFLKLPIAHGEGQYFVDSVQLKEIEDNDQIWWKYNSNINGSVDNIAGVMNKNKNVAALMPHPERAIASWMGSTDGRSFFESLI
jgi:phosphoribosylformylglycinamidine synthase I